MGFRRDCANFTEGSAAFVHFGPHGGHTEPGGSCKVQVMTIGGCPEHCTCYQPRRG